jgi:hypothetical protein
VSSITWRPRYVPQTWHTAWGSFGSRHWGHGTVRTGWAFHCARRERVLLRDILRFGTATVSYSSVSRSSSGVPDVDTVNFFNAAQRGSTRSS